MNKIDALLKNCCPNGVQYKLLEEVADIKPGKDYKHLEQGNVPVYGSGGVIAHVNESVYDRPSVLLPRKGSINNIYYVDEPFWNVDTIFYTDIDTGQLSPRYFYYVMLSKHIERFNTSNAARPALTRKVLNKLEVPVPPLQVQEEIVRVLDSFTELESKLEAELETELEKRKKQYAYYRDHLLSFEERERERVRWIAMGEAFDMQAGHAISSSLISTQKTAERTVPCYGGNGLRGYVKDGNQNNEAVLIGRQGALCGNICYVYGCYYATEHAVVALPSEMILPRFAYHMLTAARLDQYKTAGAQPGLSVQRLSRVKIPVPSLPEQQSIVDILDSFDRLVNDLSEGLPAEIEARQKQYEFYRDQLLTFDEKAAA